MTALVAFSSIIAVRDGKRVVVPPGGSFDFTETEATALLAAGDARLAHSGDKKAEATIAPDGKAAMAAARRKSDNGAAALARAADAMASLAEKLGSGVVTATAEPARRAKPSKQADEDL